MCADLPLFCGACFAGFCEFLFFSDCVLLFSVPDCCNCFLVFGASVFCGVVRCVLPTCTCVCGFLPVFSGGGINENCSPEIDCPGEQFFALCYILYFFRLAQCFWVIVVLFGCRFYSAHHYFYFGCFCKELADVVFYCLRSLLFYYIGIFKNVGFAVDAQLG